MKVKTGFYRKLISPGGGKVSISLEIEVALEKRKDERRKSKRYRKRLVRCYSCLAPLNYIIFILYLVMTPLLTTRPQLSFKREEYTDFQDVGKLFIVLFCRYI